MSETKANDCAFGIPAGRNTTSQNDAQAGLSKREYFAALVLHGELASQNEFTGLYNTDEGFKWAATKAIKIADALIKALNEGGES